MIACPRCQGAEIRKVSVSASDWFMGAYRCAHCHFLASWGSFQRPMLQMDLPFADAKPEERKQRVLHQASVAAMEMLKPLRVLSEQLQQFLPEDAAFVEMLEVAVKSERGKSKVV